MRRRNGVKTSHEMNLYKEETNIQGESTTSSDSGVVVEEQSPNLETDGITNIKTELKIDPHCSTQDDITTVHIDDFNKEVKVEDLDERAASLSSHSERSHNISIVSLDDADSSVIDSDSDFSDAPGDLIVRKLGQHSEFGKDGAIVINQHIGREPTCSSDGVGISSKPQIGSIAVQNSTDITFGNKTFYQGPVTIKQFLLENKKWTPTEGGAENPGFENDKDTRGDNNHGDLYGNGIRKKRLFDSKPVFIIGVIILLSTIVCAITFTTLAFQKSVHVSNKPGDGEDSRKNIPINSTIGRDNIGGGKVLRFVTRDEWVAQPPNVELEPLELPATKVIIAHTATEGCDTQANCVFRIRYIQTFHMESRNWDDIAYNFLVGGDGSVYEGRGWDKMGAHTKGFNRRSICVAFVGTFIKNSPPTRQLKAAQMIIAEGVKLGKLSSNYKLFGHRQLIASESPGEALYNIIKMWPHWSNEIEES